MQEIAFYKMHGCGNDFILIDNRSMNIPPKALKKLTQDLCRRGLGIGADGLILMDESPDDRPEDYIWHFYNSDGLRGEMCGNGARCAAWLAHQTGLAGQAHTLGTDAGTVRCEVFPDRNEVKVELTPPTDLQTDLQLELDGETYMVHKVNTGVPHALMLVENSETMDVVRLGRALRYHKTFEPNGTNANFAQIIDRGHMKVRTYERGVEAETNACGTGCCASVVLAHHLGLVDTQVLTKTHGGFDLAIELQVGIPFLRGPAELVYTGTIQVDFLEGA